MNFNSINELYIQKLGEINNKIQELQNQDGEYHQEIHDLKNALDKITLEYRNSVRIDDTTQHFF